nr:hypothetical protein [Tanacetum cinerariifolium]
NRFRDLPEADMKEILHQRMWETKSYKSHENHMQLFEALVKSINRDHSEELGQDLAKARKKKKKSHESPKTPRGSPYHQPPPPPPPAGPSRASRAPRASRSSQVPPSPPTPSSTNQENLEMDEDMALDEQPQSSNDEDIESGHISTVNLRQDWWKPFEEERPATPEPAWSICSSDVLVQTNNWASALASNYSPPPEDSLLVKTGDIATFMDWRISKPTGSSLHDDSPYVVLGQLDSEEESKKVVLGTTEGGNDEYQAGPDLGAQAEGQTGTDAGTLNEGQAGSNPDEMFEGQAGPDPGNAGDKEQSIPSLVVHAVSDREHMDLDVADVSPQPFTE